MAELIERSRMDASHLLKAEANISALPLSSLQALVTPSQSLESLTHALQQGELYYCSDYPQCPYVVYFRGSHYINPAAQTAASPSAIEKLRARYPFITFNDHEPPASVQNGALRRQYYTPPYVEPKPYTFKNNGMFDRPESSLNKDVWFKLFFYYLDADNQKQPVEGLPYDLQWGSSDDTFMSGKTPADGRLSWEGDCHHLNYRVYHGEPEEGIYPLFAYLPINKDEEIEVTRKSMHLDVGWVFDSGTPEGDYELIISGETFTGTLDGGKILIDKQLNSLTGSGSLTITLTDGPVFNANITLGMEPLDTVGGLTQRLTNLGFYAGDSEYNTRAQWAVRAFKRAKMNAFTRTTEENNVIDTELMAAIEQAYGKHYDDNTTAPDLGMGDTNKSTTPCDMFGSHLLKRGSFEDAKLKDDKDAKGAGNNGIWLGKPAAGVKENIAGTLTLHLRAFDAGAGEPMTPNRINLPQPISMAQFVLFELGYWMVAGSEAWVEKESTQTRNTFVPNGNFNRDTQWALREFQCYAKMNNAAKENLYSAEKRYLPRLLEQSPVALVSRERLSNEARISGALNPDTGNALQAWAEKALRCPVIAFASSDTKNNVANGSDLSKMVQENIWKYDDYTDKNKRIFAIDYTGHYDIPASYTGNVTVGKYTLPKPIVMGQYESTIQGGPVTLPRYGHSWNSEHAEVRPDTMLGKGGNDGAGLSAAELSTFRIVRVAAHFECLGMFDALNAYDDVTMSFGPCHWTLARSAGSGDGNEKREMPAFLAYFKHQYPDSYADTFGRFGLAPKNSWPLTMDTSQLKYDDYIMIQGETKDVLLCGELQSKSLRQEENTYCKTWHSYYRFQMACRTSSDMKRAMWDFTRIRIRDILDYSFELRNGLGIESIRIGDFISSEKSVAMLLRWHIFRPAHIKDKVPAIIKKAISKYPMPTVVGNNSLSQQARNQVRQNREDHIQKNIISTFEQLTQKEHLKEISKFSTIPQVGLSGRNYYRLNLTSAQLSGDINSFSFLRP